MRKQLFIVIYCYFLYVHFLINVGVGSFLIWKINHTTTVDISVACQKAITNTDAQKQCKGFLNTTQGVLNGIIVLVLLIELCTSEFASLGRELFSTNTRVVADGVLIVTRYMRQLKSEKRQNQFARSSFLLNRGGYSSLNKEDFDYTPHGRDASDSSRHSATYFPRTPQMTSNAKHESYIDQ